MKNGEKIKNLRSKIGFSQAQIANYLDVDQSYISKIESGEREISTDIIKKLSELFGVTVKSIIEEDSPAGLKVAFRTSSFENDDLKAIAVINRIALNLENMERILGE